jgi:uncharacterized membrane protein YeaQ/YmgE (transglycosylase-associated protein family)
MLVAGAVGGGAATVLVAALPPRGYFAALTAGLVGSMALGGALLERKR